MGTNSATASGAITTGDQSPLVAAHTPGPWHHGVGNPKLVWAGTKIESRLIANCTDDQYPVNDLEQVANARVCAAALDMFIALIDAAAACEGCANRLRNGASADDVAHDLTMNLARYRAALAKAAGAGSQVTNSQSNGS